MPGTPIPTVYAERFSPRLFFAEERAKRRPACDPRRFLEQQTGEPAIVEPEQEQQHRFPSRPVHPPGKLPALSRSVQG